MKRLPLRKGQLPRFPYGVSDGIFTRYKPNLFGVMSIGCTVISVTDSA